MEKDCFFALVNIALGHADQLSVALTPKQWQAVYRMAQQQSLVGFCFSAVERLPEGQRPPRELIMQWYAVTRQIEQRNMLMNRRSAEVYHYFIDNGFKAAILKGQGNAHLYPIPLRRQSGDVDVWVVPSNADKEWNWNEIRKKVYAHVLRECPDEHFSHIHIHCNRWKDTMVEVHVYPSYLKDPVAWKRLTVFFTKEAEEQFANVVTIEGETFAIPTVRFNMVFQLCHIFEHFITQGVGLRQVIDYYYQLKSLSQEDSFMVMETLQQIKMAGFAKALMWVLHHQLGLETEHLLCEPDERKGKLLLEEIMAGGNFGKYESRYWKADSTKAERYYQKLRRLSRFLTQYPGEVLWDPMFRLRCSLIERSLKHSLKGVTR